MTATSTLSADELWTKIGQFCGMPSWHPAVERCDLSADGKIRTLRFFGTSRTAVETLEARDDVGRSLAYAAASVTTSVSNYRTTVRVISEASASAVQMISSYDADGVSDADARRAVGRSLYLSLCLNGPLVCSGDSDRPPQPKWCNLLVRLEPDAARVARLSAAAHEFRTFSRGSVVARMRWLFRST